jgi:hypothetical protein
MAIFIARDGPLSAVASARPHNAAERFYCEVSVRRSRNARHASAKILVRDKITDGVTIPRAAWRLHIFVALSR